MPSKTHQLLTVARLGILVLFVVLALRLAWISDDALITLRTALNISHGWGPGFNATEAVQGYTHPLWFLIWTLLGTLSNQWILGILILSVLTSTVAVGLLVWHITSISRIVISSAFLLFSNAFMEYTTSGLENPLAYVFVSITFLITIRLGDLDTSNHSRATAVLLGLSVAGLLLTRMDLILVILPAGIVVLWQLRNRIQLLALVAVSAALPLAVWIGWSRITYSAWLPNTFAAKTNINIPREDLLLQGFKYLWVSLENDPVTFIGITLGLICGFALGNTLIRAWATGMVLSLLYILWIGGDFMAGRFLAVPLLVSVLIISSISLPKITTTLAVTGVTGLVLLSAIAGSPPVSLINPQTQRWEATGQGNPKVVDERSFYVQNNRDLGFFFNNMSTPSEKPLVASINDHNLQIRTLNELDHISKNWPLSMKPLQQPDAVLTECGLLGTIGLAIGPRNHLIDSCALTDRFLAGIPFAPDPNQPVKPGHYERVLPEGYEQAVGTNSPGFVTDPDSREQLTLLWKKIRPRWPGDR